MLRLSLPKGVHAMAWRFQFEPCAIQPFYKSSLTLVCRLMFLGW